MAGKDVVEDTKAALVKELESEILEVTDTVGCGGSAKLEVFIVSNKFEGKSHLKRHQMVQAAIRSIEDYEDRVHAITIKKALTPQQYEELILKEAQEKAT